MWKVVPGFTLHKCKIHVCLHSSMRTKTSSECLHSFWLYPCLSIQYWDFLFTAMSCPLWIGGRLWQWIPGNNAVQPAICCRLESRMTKFVDVMVSFSFFNSAVHFISLPFYKSWIPSLQSLWVCKTLEQKFPYYILYDIWLFRLQCAEELKVHGMHASMPLSRHKRHYQQ